MMRLQPFGQFAELESLTNMHDIHCKACNNEYSPYQNKCPRCGAPKPRHYGFGTLLCLVILAGMGYVYLYGFPGQGGGFGVAQYTISVSGTPGTEFSGKYATIGFTGESKPQTVKGVVPASYLVSGRHASCTFEKSAVDGTIRVEILKNGRVVASKESSEAKAIVSTSTRK
jgi:hypothetical protein